MSYERTVEVVLHGYLKDLYPEKIVLSGFSAAEIINGMCKMTKAFNPEPFKDRHFISVVGFETEESLKEALPAEIKELHIVPAMTCGKKGGFFQVVVGAVLVAAAIYFSGGLAAVLAPGFSFGLGAGLAFNFGLSLVLGGLLSMLSPQPKVSNSGAEAADPESSKYLGAGSNTVKIGTRIPIMYGEVQAYGHYISFNVDAKDVAI